MQVPLQLAPKAKLIICVRKLGQAYGSVEAQYQRIQADIENTHGWFYAMHYAQFPRLAMPGA